jgi:hypothetical protein
MTSADVIGRAEELERRHSKFVLDHSSLGYGMSSCPLILPKWIGKQIARVLDTIFPLMFPEEMVIVMKPQDRVLPARCRGRE